MQNYMLIRSLCNRSRLLPVGSIKGNTSVCDHRRQWITTDTCRSYSMRDSFNEWRQAFRQEMHVVTGATNTQVPGMTDALIIGGGAVGLAAAYFIKNHYQRACSVCVIEKDPTYKQCSSVLSVGGLRQQFSLPENIQMSLYTAEFLSKLRLHLTVDQLNAPDVHFTPTSYLFLASADGADTMKANHETQIAHKARVELLEPSELKSRFPWLNTDGVALGSCGIQNEGVFDPWLLLAALKAKCLDLGVQFINGEVYDFQMLGGDPRQEPQANKDIQYAKVRTPDGRQHTIELSFCLNCAGAAAGQVARLAGIGCDNNPYLTVPLPVEPRKRYVYVLHCPGGPGLDFPMLIDHSGIYVRREGLAEHYICGCSPPKDNNLTNMISEIDQAFDLLVKPSLVKRIPAMHAAQVKSAWAGYYDYNTFDQNLIIGTHPYRSNFYMACGSSGHGIQHAVPIGLALAELVIEGKYINIDLSRFSFDRLVQNAPIYESNIV